MHVSSCWSRFLVGCELRVLLADILDKVCQGDAFTEGLRTLWLTHHGVPQPSTASWMLVFSSQCLSGACCSHYGVARSA